MHYPNRTNKTSINARDSGGGRWDGKLKSAKQRNA